MLPYMGFIWYRVLTYHQRPFQFPSWFLYVAPCYFFGSIALLVVLRRKIVGETPPQYLDHRNLKWLWFGVGLYSLIFLNGLRLGLANSGKVPPVAIVLGEVFNAAILITLIIALRNVYKRVQQTGRLASDRGRNQEL
jgi:hypothetical protein